MTISLLKRDNKAKNPRFKTVAKGFSITLLVFIILTIGYIFGGTSSKNLSINYNVSVTKPSSGRLDVKLTVKNNKKPFLHLYLNQSKILNVTRISNIEVMSNNKALPIWNTVPYTREVPVLQSMYTIWTGFNKGPIEINYTVLVTCDNLTIKQARDNLNSHEGYMLGANFLLGPISFKDITTQIADLSKIVVDVNEAKTEVNFALPEGWKANTPWGEENVHSTLSDVRATLFYLGDMNIVENKDTGIPIRLGVYGLFGEDKLKELEKLTVAVIKNVKEITGFIPASRTPYWTVNVTSNTSLRGGMSVQDSLITISNEGTIAHEIFHWWDALQINRTKDLQWMVEGCATYYSSKVLHNIGYLTDDGFEANMKELDSLFTNFYPSKKANFTEISIKFAEGKASGAEIGAVYQGGAVIAHQMDEDLKSQGRSLDEIWKRLYESKKPVSTKEFCKILSEVGGKDLSDKYYSILTGKTSLLEQ